MGWPSVSREEQSRSRILVECLNQPGDSDSLKLENHTRLAKGSVASSFPPRVPGNPTGFRFMKNVWSVLAILVALEEIPNLTLSQEL
jgi:hypothetical protein